MDKSRFAVVLLIVGLILMGVSLVLLEPINFIPIILFGMSVEIITLAVPKLK